MPEQNGRLSLLKKATRAVLHKATIFLLPSWKLLSEDDWLLRLSECDPEAAPYFYEDDLLDEARLHRRMWLS